MCGIAGFLQIDGTSWRDATALKGRLDAMQRVMAHRGPDGDGLWMSADSRVGLAHRRLAIIDLSDLAAQPMANDDGSVVLTYNGEVYNHLPLRAELQAQGYVFRTDHSDTEVLVHGYSAWGMEGLVERLEGMFAFAIWDAKRRELHIARDRIGIKPVYFTRSGGAFRFASEIKALLSDPDVPRAVDHDAVNHYLSFMVTPAPLTMFKDIFKLPAGHIMRIAADGGVDAKAYWAPVPGQEIDANAVAGLSESARADFYADGIMTRLEDAIEKRMMSDVPFGVFLSGGIDSSANVALMNRHMTRPVDTFTVGFEDYKHLNELEPANRIAKEFNTNHHEVLITARDMEDYLRNLVFHQDEPIADWVCIPLYFVSKLAKDSGVTVVQVGEGSDEQFCGYDSYMTYIRTQQRMADPYMAAVPAALRRPIAGLARSAAMLSRRLEKPAEVLMRAAAGQDVFWSGANAFWNVHKHRLLSRPLGGDGDSTGILAEAGIAVPGMRSSDSGAIPTGYRADLEAAAGKRDTLTRMIYNEFRLRLPELLLMRVDKITMSTSVEGRVPFLDHALVEYTMDIPQADKIRDGIKKNLLKKALRGVIPDETIDRKKMGFAAPMADWLRGDFGAVAEETLRASPLLDEIGVRRDVLNGMVRDHREGRRDNALHLWTLFNLAAWHRHWIAGEAAA